MNQRIPNPDCRDGKHGICDGHGWDIDADTAVRCPCPCHAPHIRLDDYYEHEGLLHIAVCTQCQAVAGPHIVHMAQQVAMDHTQHRHGPLVLDHHKGWQCNTCGDWLPLDYRGPVHAVPLAQGGMVDIADTINSHPLYRKARPCTCGARKTHAPCTCAHIPTDNSDTYCI